MVFRKSAEKVFQPHVKRPPKYKQFRNNNSYE